VTVEVAPSIPPEDLAGSLGQAGGRGRRLQVADVLRTIDRERAVNGADEEVLLGEQVPVPAVVTGEAGWKRSRQRRAPDQHAVSEETQSAAWTIAEIEQARDRQHTCARRHGVALFDISTSGDLEPKRLGSLLKAHSRGCADVFVSANKGWRVEEDDRRL